ncbi:hypothetical protein GGR57DRAFT_451973 [Xylariaceae sp. FL1272]|nr:hypothetical protein GGR57DRAFT_451973 [Xylariaceae sp. FL1272]
MDSLSRVEMKNSDIIEITDIATFSELGKYLTACCPTALKPSYRKVHIELTCEICHISTIELPEWVRAKHGQRETSSENTYEAQPKASVDKQSGAPAAQQVEAGNEEQNVVGTEAPSHTSPDDQLECPVGNQTDATPEERPVSPTKKLSEITVDDKLGDAKEVLVVLPCDHFFGYDCWQKWLDSVDDDGNVLVCPKCRFEMIHPGCGDWVLARCLPPTRLTGVRTMPQLIPRARVHRWRTEADEKSEDPFIDITSASRQVIVNELTHPRGIAPACFLCHLVRDTIVAKQAIPDDMNPLEHKQLLGNRIVQITKQLKYEFSDTW